MTAGDEAAAETLTPPSGLAAAGPASGTICPTCGERIAPGENFCEACGTQLVEMVAAPVAAPVAATDPANTILTPPPSSNEPTGPIALVAAGYETATGPCPSCGSTESTGGWCDVCGTRMPTVRDHFTEVPAAWVAGVCDRGLRHARNEDAMALSADETPGSFAALVVCDGVSSTPDSDVAALEAARAASAALSALGDELRAAAPMSQAFVVQTLCQALIDAGAAGHIAATGVAKRAGVADNPPSCTFAAAVVSRGMIAAGWAGDSRVYWLPDGVPGQQLSVDDSWATQQVLAGVQRDVAEADPQAHAITKWLGADSADPSITCASIDTKGASGWLLVCSDGLWNYVSQADALRTLIDEVSKDVPDGDPLPVAQLLVDFANRQGGHDNITVALARLGPASPQPVDGTQASSKPLPSAEPPASVPDSPND